MPSACLVIGLVGFLMDRFVDKKKILDLHDLLHFYMTYYQPFPRRRAFYILLFLVSSIAAMVDYLIHQQINYVTYLIVFLLFYAIPYIAILFLSVFDQIFLKQDFQYNFFRLETECMQQFTLALFIPLIALAFLVRLGLLSLLYPVNGLLWFKSLAGLIGFLLIIVSTLTYLVPG